VVQPPQGERAPDLSAWLVWTVGKQPQREHFSIMRNLIRNLVKGLKIMATLEDQVIALTSAVAALQTNMVAIGAQVTDIDAKVSALAAPAAPDLTAALAPVLAAIADVKAQLEPTPAAPPAA
jgi:hypothetical protein